MRKVVLLAAVGIALAVALALNGTSVLSRLSSEDHSAAPTVAATPTPTPAPTEVPSATSTGGPLPGTVLTARPAPRRCPSPPCVP
ncbi:hypothetical protein [Nocardioides marmorisolisilvae]|uniref:hypothetical protein n=1 Tax=Nocardioides marmorisolisilvae TaxID=1542737 RepID=UPI0011CE663D|nr:hypothetical protein [Nocardioides marmorisolisilvae]